MAKVEVTNLTDRNQEIVVSGYPVDGVPPTFCLEARKTETLDINLRSSWIKAMVGAGILSIKEEPVKPAAPPKQTPSPILKGEV